LGTFLWQSLNFSCSSVKQNKEVITLELSPKIGSEYEINTNMNIALDMKMPLNVNMDFFIRTRFDSLTKNEEYAISSSISKVNVIMSTGVLYKSYSSDNPVIEGEVEQQLHDRLSKIIGVNFNGLMSKQGVTRGLSNLDSIFGGDEELKKQFAEVEKSFSNGGFIFPESAVTKGTSWTRKIETSGDQKTIQDLSYTVKKITQEEVFVLISGDLSYGNTDIKGGGKIKGEMRLNRKTGIHTYSKIVQDYKMNIEGYKANGINTCLLYTSPSPRDRTRSRMPSSA